MSHRRRRLVRALLPAICWALAASAAVSAELRIVAPSAAGSGWDQIAQALRSGLADDLGGATIVDTPGNGGTIGLAAFLADGLDEAVLVTGLTMLDATFVYRSPSRLEALTPVARLATEPFAVAVPSASPIRTVDELRRVVRDDPGQLTWGGGPLGSIDQVAATLLVQALGGDLDRAAYVPFLSTQDGVAAAAESRIAGTVLPLGELAAEVEAGRLRLVAVLGPERLRGSDVPTLQEAGIPLEFGNWRGLLARPGLPEAARLHLLARLAAAVDTQGWRDFLERKGWRDAWLPGPPFGSFLADESARLKAALKANGFLRRAP